MRSMKVLSQGTIKHMFQQEVRQKISEELERGEAARRQGLEGRARVCARRAASAAARAVLAGRGVPGPGASAMDLLSEVSALPGVSAAARQAAERLLMRVDESYALPAEIDLLAEARLLVGELEGISGEAGTEDRSPSSGEG